MNFWPMVKLAILPMVPLVTVEPLNRLPSAANDAIGIIDCVNGAIGTIAGPIFLSN